jgi:hypothetical protein
MQTEILNKYCVSKVSSKRTKYILVVREKTGSSPVKWRVQWNPSLRKINNKND